MHDIIKKPHSYKERGKSAFVFSFTELTNARAFYGRQCIAKRSVNGDAYKHTHTHTHMTVYTYVDI